MIGRIVGNYKIIQALGEGGVGMVYKGVDTMLDREVAIKVLRPELASQTSVVERFRSEAVTLAKLSHPNIATLYSLFRDGQDLLMVLEFIKGETLDHTLHRRGKIPTDEAIPIFCQALEGINYAHKLGIVHRDIKPGNMMLTDDDILKVLDFGIARLLGSNRMTRIGNVIGTLEYMSPEQVRGHETDARSDVYGMGIMLYEMLTGRLPFESENDFALMKMQTENTPVPPRQLNPNIPAEVENAIMKSVAKDPNQRFQSAGDFLDYFLEIGFALPNTTFYNKKKSRPSNPGINSGKISTDESLQMPPVPSPIQIPTPPIISKSEIPVTLEVKKEIKKEQAAETRLAKNEGETKGTRLATPTTPVPNELKSTRLGAVETNEVSSSYDKSPSFFAKLNWIHYTVAGAIVLFFFSLATVAMVLPFVWGGNEKPKVEKTNPAVSPTPPPAPTSQPLAQESPVANPKQDGGGGVPIYSANNSEINTNPGTAITPIPGEAKPAVNNVSQPVQNQPRPPERERETVKNKPPPPKQQPKQPSPPPRQQTPRESGGTKKDLTKILTDN